MRAVGCGNGMEQFSSSLFEFHCGELGGIRLPDLAAFYEHNYG
jgi:hypothetical protein